MFWPSTQPPPHHQPTPTHQSQLLVNDNLDLGCTIIERAATDKAVRDIDKSLAAQYEARINARRSNVDFYQRAMLQQQAAGPFPGALPESLTPKPGNPAQQRVYEDFGRLPRGHPLPARGYGEGGAPPGSPLQVSVDGGAAGVVSGSVGAAGQPGVCAVRWSACTLLSQAEHAIWTPASLQTHNCCRRHHLNTRVAWTARRPLAHSCPSLLAARPLAAALAAAPRTASCTLLPCWKL
jgi:hypothetical protein